MPKKQWIWADGYWHAELTVESEEPGGATGSLQVGTLPQPNEDHEPIPIGKFFGPEEIRAGSLEELRQKANAVVSDFCGTEVALK